MAVNVLNTLQHTGPAFVHAPTLATVRSWSSLRIILEEATEMDEICCQRVDPQDLANPLHMGNFSGTGEDASTAHGEDAEGRAAEEGEEESDHSPDDNQDETPDEHDPAGTSAAGATTTTAGMESDDIAAPTTALDEPAPGDPLHVVHSITDATAPRPPFQRGLAIGSTKLTMCPSIFLQLIVAWRQPGALLQPFAKATDTDVALAQKLLDPDRVSARPGRTLTQRTGGGKPNKSYLLSRLTYPISPPGSTPQVSS